MGFFKWLFGPREVNVHIHGTLNLNCENLQLNSSIGPNEPKAEGPEKSEPKKEFEIEPDLGDLEIPDHVDFGEDVET